MQARKLAQINKKVATKLSIGQEGAMRFLETGNHEKFWGRVNVSNDTDACWEWRIKQNDRYAKFSAAGVWVNAHIVAYVLKNKSINPGEIIDHICKNTKCVNPHHLRAVSNRFNIVDNSDSPIAQNARKTHCKHGHEFTVENTRIKNGNERECRTCNRAAQYRFQERKKIKQQYHKEPT